MEGFNYKDYLKKDGIYSVVYWSEIELLESGQGNRFYAQILFFKNKLRESIYNSLSPPQSSILEAVILGNQRSMSEEVKEKLNITGLRHITAVSGQHVVILTGILMAFLIGLGFWRGQAFYLTIFFIFIFIAMTGFQSSGIRAGIMGGLFLLGQKLGRLSFNSRAIITAATLMLAVNPLLLKLDVGFQLSFLAVLGIIYLMPVFLNWFRGKLSILAMTLAAQIFTLPILIYNFGNISLVAPLTNILIVPLFPFIMVLGFVSGLVGIFWQSLGQILSWPVWLLLTYLMIIVDWFSGFSWVALSIGKVHWLWLIVAYLILGFVTWRLNKRIKFVI